MLRTRGQQIDYKLFLPAIAAAVREKYEDKDTQLTDAEFEAMVSILYRDSVIEFMKDSKMYRIEIPIDIYAGVRYYPIVPPDGYYVESAIRLRAGNRKTPPAYLLDERDLIIDEPCCPDCDVDNAFYVEVAIVPNITDNTCKFDAHFVNKYYNAILLAMERRLFAMNREWKDIKLSDMRGREYRRAVSEAIGGGYYYNKAAKIRWKRFSESMCGDGGY